MANYAGAGSRIVAIIIDHIILAIISVIIAIPIFGLSIFAMSATGMSDPTAFFGAMAGFWGISILLTVLYFTYLEGTSGQTLGKKLVTIKVVKEDGKKPTMTDAFVRTILRIIDSQIAYLIGFILILATEKKQRLGDIAAKTIVVKA